jgi:glycosyltransferase involved in cell wall biosynthesis
VGHEEPYADEVRALARSLGCEERVVLCGYLPAERLEALWRAATCAAFPTRGEGFGLPLLEAMARGVPVACSDLPVLREVGGDVPAYFPPDDEHAAARAIAAVAGDEKRGADGRERARGFTWRAAARGTMAAYERALHRSSGI